MSGKRVVVAMSGGVDSSVAAAILRDEGYHVTGVTMWLQSESQAVERAQGVAEKLGIPHHVADFRDIFSDRVITDFCSQYSRGRTPNPCVKCNRYIKFDALFNWAMEMGAEFMATGHHARVLSSMDGFRLLKGIDPAKDQSYFLYTLGQRQLGHLLLPIGNFHKQEVRGMAAELGLPITSSQESQDICFISDGDYRSFITGRVQLEPGDIVDTEYNLLGRHKGLALYTVGQRQGLGLATASRRYVLRIDAGTNRLVVGTEDQLLSSRLVAVELNWVSGKAPKGSGIKAKIRYKSPEVSVELQIKGDTAEVCFGQPQRAVTPGQAVVFYQGDTVIGGGVIESS